MKRIIFCLACICLMFASFATAQPDQGTQDALGLELTKAANEGDFDSVRALLLAGANVNRVNPAGGGTALSIVSERGHSLIAAYLLMCKADPNLKSDKGATAIFLASQQGHETIVEALIKYHADVNTQTKKGATPLLVAAAQGYPKVVKMFLAAKADPNIRTTTGETAILMASGRGHLEIVNELIKYNAEVNIEDKDGITPLMDAAKYGFTDVARVLVSAKANVKALSGGRTALDYATEKGHKEIVQLLNGDAVVLGAR